METRAQRKSQDGYSPGTQHCWEELGAEGLSSDWATGPHLQREGPQASFQKSKAILKTGNGGLGIEKLPTQSVISGSRKKHESTTFHAGACGRQVFPSYRVWIPLIGH